MSDTPRTDEWIKRQGAHRHEDGFQFARRLERELAACQALYQAATKINLEAIAEIQSLSWDKERLDWILGLIEGGNEPARCIIDPNGEPISRWKGASFDFNLRTAIDLSMLRWTKIYDPLRPVPPR